MCNTRVKIILVFGYVVSFAFGQESYLPCGRQKVKTTFLIHKGSDALAGYWPWHVAVFNKDEYQCGGSILDQNTILTAAHCVYNSGGLVSKRYVSVHVGRVHLNLTNQHTLIHNVAEIIVHPGFKSNSVHNDIAVIKLSSNITMTDYVQPVCLWTGDSKLDAIVGKNGTVVGFGINEQDMLTGQLKQAPIQVVDPFTCIQMDRDVFATHLTPEVFCGIGKAGVSACNGDSGGGLVFEVKGKWFVRGLVSYTPRRGNLTWNLCEPLKPTVYTDVTKYLDWIKQYIDQRVLPYASGLFEIDYEEKLRLFNFQTCGIKSNTCFNLWVNWTVPWLGTVQSREIAGFVCGITLISEWYAVGPAHCFEYGEGKIFIVLGGSIHGECDRKYSSRLRFDPGQERDIKNVIKHPDFDRNNYDHDVALIELMTPADISQPNVEPICMPVTAQLRSNATTNLHVARFEKRRYFENIPLRYVESDQCIRQYPQGILGPNLGNPGICAKEVTLRCAYSKAEGLPLQEMKLVNGKERYFLRGLDLFGFYCPGERPKFYLNVEPYLDWILYNMRYQTVEASYTSVNSTVNQSHESEWSKLQLQPGKEKLRLFNMDLCGVISAANQLKDHVPWLGVKGREEFLLVLISEWYALALKKMVQNTDGQFIILGKRGDDEDGKQTFQHVEIKNIIIPPPDHPSQTFALIELLEPADLTNPYIRPICLPFMENLRQRTFTEILLSTKLYSSRNLTELARSTCHNRLLWQGLPLAGENATCATGPEKGYVREKEFGSPLQIRVQFRDSLRYFLYGMVVSEFSGYIYNIYLFDKIKSADLEWILDNMQEKERQSTMSNERVNLGPIQVPRSKRKLFDFNACGISSTTYPTPWIGSFACRFDGWVTYDFDQVTLISDLYAVGSANLNDVCSTYKVESIVVFGYPCIEGINKQSLSLKSNIIESCGAPTQWITVQKIVIHPQYNDRKYANDIALIRLAAPANISLSNVKPICLPVIDTIRSYDTSSLSIVAYSLAKQYDTYNVSKRYVDTTKCQRMWKNWEENVTIDNSNHCVMSQRASLDVCIHASRGGSLQSRQRLGSSERYFLRGVALKQPDICSEIYPAVYTNTDAYLNWLLETMEPLPSQPFDLRKELVFGEK